MYGGFDYLSWFFMWLFFYNLLNYVDLCVCIKKFVGVYFVILILDKV